MNTDPSRPASSPAASRVAMAFGYVYIAWGTTYLAIHYALQTLPPFLLVGLRFSTAGAILIGFVAIFSRATFRWGSAREWIDAFMVGMLLLVGGNGTQSWSQQFVNTSSTALIFGSMPLWLIFFDWIRPGGRAPTLRTGIGLALGFAGLCVLFRPSPSTTGGAMETWGKFALLGAACSWAAGSIYSRHVHAQGSPLLPMARQMIVGGVVLLTLSALHGDWVRFSFNTVSVASWLGFGYLVVFGSLFGFTAYVWLMRVSTPARVSTIPNANLTVAVLIGWTIGGEAITVHALIGAVIIVAAVMLVLTKPATRPLEVAPAVEA